MKIKLKILNQIVKVKPNISRGGYNTEIFSTKVKNTTAVNNEVLNLQ